MIEIILFVIAIIYFVQSSKLKDPMGNYLPEGQKKRKIALICLIIAIVIEILGFTIGFANGFMRAL